MRIKKIIADYSRYNHWANETMIRWLQSLDSSLVYEETPSSFRSIDVTLQHMKHAQNFWLAVITETDFTKLDETIQLNAIENIMHNLLEGSQKMISICNSYTEEQLLQKVSTHVTTQSRYQSIMHVVNHNSYHRGQIVTMSHCLAVSCTIPETDYETFLWAGY